MRLGSSLSELADPISLLYADFPVLEDAELVDFDARIEPVRSPWGLAKRMARCFVDGRPAFDPFPRRQAPAMLEWALNWCVFTRPTQYLLLHAAVVERHGRALILSGKPGAGKSTLTAGLVLRGWRLFSDEVAIIPTDRPEILPLPRPVSLKGPSIDLVRQLSPSAVIGPTVDETRKGRVAHLRPPAESVARAAEPAVPAQVVFPQFVPGSRTELQPVSRAEALLRLAHESFTYSVLGGPGFEALANVIDGCTCFRLSFGALDEALSSLDDVTGSGAHPPGPAVMAQSHD
jgi:HprK-related kinase A